MKHLLLTMMLAWAGTAGAADYSSVAITYAPPGTTNSGTALTNAIAANSTNAVMSDPIGLTRYDSCAI